MSGVNSIKFVDKFVGSIICFFLGFFNIKKNIKSKNILLIQLWGIGESVLTLPAIKELRKKYPKSNISILITKRNKDVYYNNKNINRQITINLNLFSIIIFILKNWKKYDLVIDMEEYLNVSSILSFFIGKTRIGYNHNIRSRLYTKSIKYKDNQHISQTFTDLLIPLNIKAKVKKLEKLNYSINDQKVIDKLLPKNNYICIVAGAAESAKSRMWPKENFIKLTNILAKKEKIVFTGSPNEKELIGSIIKKISNNKNIINLAGKSSIRQLFYLVKKCKLVISNDTGPMHIAAAQDVKTIGLFGPNLPVRFGPLNKKSISVYKKGICKYSPCINVHKGQVPECRFLGKEYQKCMKAIKVKDILNEM